MAQKKNIQNIFIAFMAVIFVGEIYVNPFAQWFRFSFAVVILSLLLLYFKDISIIVATSITSVCVTAFRIFVYYMTFDEATIFSALINYFPVSIFYIVFGILFYFLDVRNKTNNIIFFILSLWFCDTIANLTETVFRSFFALFNFNRAVYLIVVVGFMRAVATSLIYHIILYHKRKYEKEQNENRYKKLVLFISELKAEIFFLAKSREDIENTMEKSYKLYENIKDKKLKEDALDIAKNIHEIKKDYYRVLAGFEETLSKGKENVSLDINELFNIIKENTDRMIKAKEKDISLNMHVNDNFIIIDYYSLASILNNLIINAIDAINDSGVINVVEYKENNKYVIKVEDNGCGIEEEDLDIIFEPGYTTKYNSLTGNMSTGLGLSHVKQLVENNFKGEIYVHSVANKGTTFKIVIPVNKIEK